MGFLCYNILISINLNKSMFIKKNSLRGVAALVTVISLGSLVFMISLSTTILAFWSIKNIDSNQKSMSAYYAAYSGIQDALVKLERNKDFSGEYYLSVNDVNDVAVIVSNTGESITISSEAVSGQIHKKIETTADIENTTGLIVPVQTQEVIISAITTITTTTTTTTVPPCDENVTFTYKGAQVTYGIVHNPVTNMCWMDRNLGASRVAEAYNDSEAYGDLFQWGRLDDGHQSRNSGTTDELATTSNPGHSNFILTGYTNSSCWLSPPDSSLWYGDGGVNDPCPSGWRLPTNGEWKAEYESWGEAGYNGAFNSPLKLTTGGYRSFNSPGDILNVGTNGGYWDMNTYNNYSGRLSFSSASAGASIGSSRAAGYSVRCTQDTPLKDNGEVCSSPEECFSSFCYVDEDGDRYAPASGGTSICQLRSPYTGVDCCDLDSRVRPGADRDYYTSQNNCGTWDYDCNGEVTKQSRSCGNQLTVSYGDLCPCTVGEGLCTCGYKTLEGTAEFAACGEALSERNEAKWYIQTYCDSSLCNGNGSYSGCATNSSTTGIVDGIYTLSIFDCDYLSCAGLTNSIGYQYGATQLSIVTASPSICACQ